MKKTYNVENRIVNTYIIGVSSGFVMVDTGYDYSLVSVERNLNKLGIDLEEYKIVIRNLRLYPLKG